MWPLSFSSFAVSSSVSDLPHCVHRLYDDRISGLDTELAQLNDETHPEYTRQLAIIDDYRQQKQDYERKLFAYRLKSLCTKSQVDRVKIHSSCFQSMRDVREKSLDEVAALYYRIQQDRFQNPDAVPTFSIPFPTSHSRQVAQQAAYNDEVSILSGVAKYVGFPAAPAISSTRQSEWEEDFGKMGISLPPNQHNIGPAALPSSSSSAIAPAQPQLLSSLRNNYQYEAGPS